VTGSTNPATATAMISFLLIGAPSIPLSAWQS
jgi:hypothetical protein